MLDIYSYVPGINNVSRVYDVTAIIIIIIIIATVVNLPRQVLFKN
jgi:hypothetical protein